MFFLRIGKSTGGQPGNMPFNLSGKIIKEKGKEMEYGGEGERRNGFLEGAEADPPYSVLLFYIRKCILYRKENAPAKHYQQTHPKPDKPPKALTPDNGKGHPIQNPNEKVPHIDKNQTAIRKIYIYNFRRHAERSETTQTNPGNTHRSHNPN